jgi:hypothetical protein
MTMANWDFQVIDVKRAFLKGRFADGESLFLRVPQEFEAFRREPKSAGKRLEGPLEFKSFRSRANSEITRVDDQVSIALIYLDYNLRSY